MESLYSADEALEKINRIFEEEGYAETLASFNSDGGFVRGVHIENSHRVRSRRVREEVCRILERTEGANRTYGNFSAEWAGHNFIYSILRIGSVGSADLELAGDKRVIIRFFSRMLDFMDIH